MVSSMKSHPQEIKSSLKAYKHSTQHRDHRAADSPASVLLVFYSCFISVLHSVGAFRAPRTHLTNHHFSESIQTRTIVHNLSQRQKEGM